MKETPDESTTPIVESMTSPSGHGEDVENDHVFRINAMPNIHRRITIAFVLIPRTVLGLATAWIGC
eukprot:9959969-Heterocapsa_arctica.AAC.1